MECIHRFQVDSQNIGTCSLCDEVRQFPWDRKEPVIVLKKGNPGISQVPGSQESQKSQKEDHMSNIKGRHRYYEDNKQAIVADLLSMGRSATRKKWGISSSTLHTLQKRWLTEEQRLKIPVSLGTPPGTPGETPHPSTNSTPSNGRLPPFPQFSDTWKPEVQLEWLEIYGRLAEKQPRPHVPA